MTGGRPGAARATLRQRVRAALVRGASWLASRLPEPLVTGLAELAGEVWYRVTPARAARARANLARVVGWLAANDAGDVRVRAAAASPAALERLVRSAYRHAARYYLDMIRIPTVGRRLLRERLIVETPEVVERAFGSGRPVIFTGLHFGAIELPALYLSERSGRRTTAPMETLADPALQSWVIRTRSEAGINVVGLAEARRELLAALQRGESIGLVGDRDLSGNGIAVPLFGAPARLPVGPALLALETGAPLFVAAVRRGRGGRWLGQLREIDVPRDEARRARLVGTLERLAQAFEASVAAAPDQWWTVFYPIWDDLTPAETTADRLASNASGHAAGSEDGR